MSQKICRPYSERAPRQKLKSKSLKSRSRKSRLSPNLAPGLLRSLRSEKIKEQEIKEQEIREQERSLEPEPELLSSESTTLQHMLNHSMRQRTQRENMYKSFASF